MIHFRTRLEGNTLSYSGYRTTRGHSTEIRGLRDYVVGDDPRDIAWKRGSSSRGLYTKEREESLHPGIVLYSTLSPSSEQYIREEDTLSKGEWGSILSDELSLSANMMRVSYEESRIQDTTVTIYTRKIIFLIVDIESSMSIGSLIDTYFGDGKNDIILIFLVHPDEIPYTSTSILYESYIIGNTYRNKYDILLSEMLSLCQKKKLSYLFATTAESPTLILNHFFKYRYVR